MKVRYEATVKVVITGEVNSEDDIIDNAQREIDEAIRTGIEDEIGEEMDISIDSKLDISK